MVESQPSKLLVAGSIPVSRSSLCPPRRGDGGPKKAKADVAQLAERVLGKDEVSSSILDIGSREHFSHEREDLETWPKRNSTAASRT